MSRYPRTGITSPEHEERTAMERTRTAAARIALVTTLALGVTSLASAPAGASTGGPRARMLRATNQSRTKHEVRKVDIHYRISKLVRKHSVAMARKGKVFHTGDPAGRYLDGIKWSWWGENVGATPGTIAELERAFMDSTPHRANILNEEFRRVAVGTYRDGEGVLWVTVFFYG
jgi:uncharacterized protein YkwD